ncbi:LexA repressor, partial [Agathobacter rectalis]
NGYAPTIREICKMVGVASTSSVYAHLKILEEKGYIARKMDASRAIAIL